MIGIPAAWLLIEWFRSWFLSGFGSLAVGYSQTDTWLGHLAPVTGQYGIPLLALVIPAALVDTGAGIARRERIVAGTTHAVAVGRGIRCERDRHLDASRLAADHGGGGAGRDSPG